MSFRLHACYAMTVAAFLPALSSFSVRADIIPGKPDAIVCSVRDPTGVLPWERLVFYVSAHMRDGNTLYKSSTSDPVVLLVGTDGVLTGANLADCDGRTIDSLREENRAFTLTTARPGGDAETQ